MEKIVIITQQALAKANKTLSDIDVFAVTSKPGLAGSLLVGVCFAKAVAWAQHKKIIGINHLEGHAFSASIEHTVPFDHICLTASGGHTSLYLRGGLRGFKEIRPGPMFLDSPGGSASHLCHHDHA